MSFLGSQIIKFKMKINKKLKNLHTFPEEINKSIIKLFKQDKIYEMKNKIQDLSAQKYKISKISVNSSLKTKV